MAHNRCSACRQEVGIRHKRNGYLFCDSCLQGGRPAKSRGHSLFGFFRMAWNWLSDLAFGGNRSERQGAEREVFNARTRARMASAQWKALAVPTNPAAVSPQMR